MAATSRIRAGDLLRPAVVADPFAAEPCLLWGEPAVDRLGVDRLGDVPVGTVEPRRVGVAGAVGLAAATGPQGDAACCSA